MDSDEVVEHDEVSDVAPPDTEKDLNEK